MSRTVRRSASKGKWRYYRSLNFASQKSHEHGRLDLLEHQIVKHRYDKPKAWDDCPVKSLQEIPSKLINEGKFYWDGDVWQRKNPDYRKEIKTWSWKRKTNTKGACTIKKWEFENESVKIHLHPLDGRRS